MSSERASRRALLIGVSSPAEATFLATREATERVEAMLTRQFGFEVERCEGEAATRIGMLEHLRDWARRCSDDGVDVCVVYYFGHAGRVRFDASSQVLGYVTCHRVEPHDADGHRPFEAVLGVELSVELGALASPERSVIALLDCCYANAIVREGRTVETIRSIAAPTWVRELLAVGHADLAVDSHPGIIRLVSSTAVRESFARTVRRQHIGYMTEALLDTIANLGSNAARVTWDFVAHRVRQHVIDRVGEGQWVCFAGPRGRVLFATDQLEIQPTVGVCIDPYVDHRAWLRAGRLQAVRVGDTWVVADPLGARRCVGRVIEVEANRARLEFAAGVDVSALGSNAAFLVAVQDPVHVDTELDDLRARVEGSAWLGLREGADARIEARGSGIVIEDPNAAEVRLEADVPVVRAVDVLEDRARAHRLLASLADRETGRRGASLPFEWSWGVVGEEMALPKSGARVSVDARLWFRFSSLARRAHHWFLNVLYVDPSECAWQLNARAPEGLEFERGGHGELGRRAAAGSEGLGLPRRAGVVSSRSNGNLVLLATQCPLELGHLVRRPVDATADAYAMQGLRRRRQPGRVRGPRSTPQLSLDWAVEIVDFELIHPCPGLR